MRFVIIVLVVLAWFAWSVSPAYAKALPPPVDLNQASLSELVALPGVGEKRAEEIMRYRAAHPFRRLSDLLRVRGFGRRSYFKLKPYLRLGPPKAIPAQASQRSN